MSKTLCAWKRKEIEKSLSELQKLISPNRYICLKCARSAADKEALCKAKKWTD